MATLRQIAEVMAEAMGVQQEDIADRGRILREAGLLPESRQGKGAWQYTSHDVALVLISQMTALTPRRSVVATRQAAALKQALVRNSFGVYTQEQQHAVPPPFRDATFAEVLTFLLDFCRTPAGRREAEELILSVRVRRSPPIISMAVIDLLSGPRPAGQAWELIFVPREAKKSDLAKVEGMTRLLIQRNPPAAELTTTCEVRGGIFPIIGELLGRDEGEQTVNHDLKWPTFSRAA